MFCGILDEMKTTIIIFIALVFLSIIVYFFNDKIQYLEHTVARQNQVLSEFITNVQRDLAYSSGLGVSNLNDSNVKIVKTDEVDKIVISEDEYDSDSESDSDSDSDSESDDDSESDHNQEKQRERECDKKNIKVIELVDNEEKDDNVESHLKEVNNDDLNISSNIKKIELVNKEDKNVENHSDADSSGSGSADGDCDVVGSKKMSVAELRAAVVAKGLANTASANKMKKLELVEALSKL